MIRVALWDACPSYEQKHQARFASCLALQGQQADVSQRIFKHVPTSEKLVPPSCLRRETLQSCGRGTAQWVAPHKTGKFHEKITASFLGKLSQTELLQCLGTREILPPHWPVCTAMSSEVVTTELSLHAAAAVH